MGLTTWAAFTPGVKAEVMVAGDFVLFEDEVNAAMSAALDGGLSVTALHNHFFADDPKVYFMHIGGEGGTVKLATSVRAPLDAVKSVRAAHPQPQRVFGKTFAPTGNAITAAPLDVTLGAKGQVKDGMYKAVFGRTAAATWPRKWASTLGPLLREPTTMPWFAVIFACWRTNSSQC